MDLPKKRGEKTVHCSGAGWFLFTLIVGFLFILKGSALGQKGFDADSERRVVDRVGRTITLPRTVQRVAALNADAARILVALGLGDHIVAIDGSENQCIMLQKVYPQIASKKVVGAVHAGTLSFEKLAEAAPDVVFLSGLYPDVADSIQKSLGIPTPCIYPTLKGIEDFLGSIELIGGVMDRNQRATEINETIRQVFHNIAARLAEVQETRQPSILLLGMPLSPERLMVARYFSLTPYVKARYAVPKDFQGSGLGRPGVQVSIENIMRWDPDVIFISGMAFFSPEDLRQDPLWRDIRAVKNGAVYKIPTGHMGYEPASLAIMPLTIAKILYPERFEDVVVEKEANTIIKSLYGVERVYSALKADYGFSH